MLKDHNVNIKIDWRSDSNDAYDQRKYWMRRMREVIEELQFLSGAAEILQENQIAFLDLEGDDFPRINISKEAE